MTISGTQTYYEALWSRKGVPYIWSAERGFWCNSIEKARCIWSRGAVSTSDRRTIGKIQSKAFDPTRLSYIRIWQYRTLPNRSACDIAGMSVKHKLHSRYKYYAASILISWRNSCQMGKRTSVTSLWFFKNRTNAPTSIMFTSDKSQTEGSRRWKLGDAEQNYKSSAILVFKIMDTREDYIS